MARGHIGEGRSEDRAGLLPRPEYLTEKELHMTDVKMMCAFCLLLLAVGCAASSLGETDKATVSRLEVKIVPWVEFDKVDIGIVIQYLQAVSAGDEPKPNGKKSDVKMVFCVRSKQSEEDIPKITFKAQDLALSTLIAKIAEIAKLRYHIGQGIVIFWKSSESDPPISSPGSPIFRLKPEEVPEALPENVLAYHISRRKEMGSFSVVKSIDLNNMSITEYPSAVMERILAMPGLKRDDFVPSSYLRLPNKDEKDPKDSQGAIYRGTEDKRNGERVYVMYASKVERIDENTFKIYVVEHCGPIAASGRSYVVVRTSFGWLVNGMGDSWIS